MEQLADVVQPLSLKNLTPLPFVKLNEAVLFRDVRLQSLEHLSLEVLQVVSLAVTVGVSH